MHAKSFVRRSRRALLLGAFLWLAGPAGAATIVVTSAADPGNGVCDADCTLREAITQANGTALADTINFAIPTPVKTEILITLASPLPTITKPLTINGYSATFTSVNTLASGTDAKIRIRLDGATSVARAFGICADSVRIKGLSITGFVDGIDFGTTAAGAPCASQITGGIVSGNFIGLRSDGTTAGANALGITVANAQVVIGGEGLADRNIVSKSTNRGITVGGDSNGTLILNNLVGTDRSGTLDRGNGLSGIEIGDAMFNVTIGKPSAPNTIAYNQRGIVLLPGSSIGIAWYANNVFGNDLLGIDIGADGITPNDVNDIDSGPNGSQNFPVIGGATRVAGGVSVNGSLDGVPSTSIFKIALYASVACDDSGNGEGERFLGAVDTTIVPGGAEAFLISLGTSDSLPPGTVITATATDPNNSNSSEFSACFPLDPPPLVVNSNADTDDTICNAANCTLREAINAANARVGADVISFAIGTGLKVISPGLPLPTITGTVAIDGYTQPGASANTLAVGDDAVIAIQIDGNFAGDTTSGLGVCADNTVIRGLALTRFKQAGIRVGGTTTGANCASGDPTGVVVAGNFVGIAPGGGVAGNLADGINVRLSDATRIGGSAAADRNVVSANGGGGVVISQPSNGRQVDNNYIGTDPGGTQDRGNAGAGLLLSTNADNVEVGVLARNRIGFNQNGIVMIQNTGGTSNTFAQNDIFSNDGLGIDIDVPGVTPNDTDDADIGGNGVQNFPVLTLAQRSAGGIKIEGSLDVTADTILNTYAFAVYANASCDVSLHGEGERYLGTFSLKLGQPPNASESFGFNLATEDPLPQGTQITATATDPGGNTSEFSECIAASDPSTELVVTSTADTGGTTCGATCTLRQAINAANLRPGEDQITFAIPSGPFVIAPATPLPTITEAVEIDGYSQLGSSPNTLEEGDDAVILIRIDGGAGGYAYGLGICGDGTTVRGLAITGFPGAGIGIGFDSGGVVCASAPSVIRIEGNFVGLAPDGTAAGNDEGGVLLREDDDVVIGGNGPGARNVISANGSSGLTVFGAAAARLVLGNYIGTDPSGTADRGNLFGVVLGAQCAGLVLGRETPNRIAFNGTGVEGVGSAGGGNAFFQNEFFANDNLAIDLGTNGVTANDADDADDGANGGQNFPVLDSVVVSDTGFVVAGSLDVPAATSNARYTIALYESAQCDPSGHGEGAILLASSLSLFSGNAESFEISPKLAPPAPGHVITATATDPAGSTSEFSACLVVPVVEGVFSDSYE